MDNSYFFNNSNEDFGNLSRPKSPLKGVMFVFVGVVVLSHRQLLIAALFQLPDSPARVLSDFFFCFTCFVVERGRECAREEEEDKRLSIFLVARNHHNTCSPQHPAEAGSYQQRSSPKRVNNRFTHRRGSGLDVVAVFAVPFRPSLSSLVIMMVEHCST